MPPVSIESERSSVAAKGLFNNVLGLDDSFVVIALVRIVVEVLVVVVEVVVEVVVSGICEVLKVASSP
jgi:hypothetical protein